MRTCEGEGGRTEEVHIWGEARNEVKTRKRGEMMKWNEGEGVARKDLKGGKAAGERGGREGWFRGGEGGDGGSVSQRGTHGV